METFLNLPTQLWSLFADLNLPFILSAIVLVLIVENYWAAEKEQSLAGVTFNTKYTILYLAVALLTQPLLAYTTGLVIQACGGSWYTPRFHFKSEALNQLALGFTYLFIFDFFLLLVASPATSRSDFMESAQISS